MKISITARVLLLVLLSLSIFSCSSEKAEEQDNRESKIFSQNDLLNCIRVNNPVISPDGKWVIYTAGIPNVAANKMNNELFAVSIDGKEKIRLTDNPKGDFNPIWSIDGKQVLFLSTRSGAPQAYLMDFPDGKARKITDIPGGIANLNWSPDGSYLSFSSDVKLDKTPADIYPDLPLANVKMWDKVPVRHWDEWTDENYQHVFIMPFGGGEPVDLMAGEKYESPLKPDGGAEQIAWSPDGKEIAYVSKKVDNYVWSTNSDIYIYDIQTKNTKNITLGMEGYDLDPKYSPDGKWIAFNSQQRPGFESDKIRIMLYNRQSGEIFELTKNIDQWVSESVWSPDSKEMFFAATDSGSYHIFSVNISDQSVQRLTKGWFNYSPGLDISSNGNYLVFGKQNMQMPTELFRLDIKADEQKQLTFENTDNFRKFRKVTVQEKWVKATDGKDIHCWVILPPDFDPNKKYPMLTFCQGGPQAMVATQFHYRWNFFTMASHGYVIVAPNRRGVPGFGQAWNDAISLDWGGQAMRDLLSATDAMANEPYIDKNRLAAVGASAGGYATFWLAGNHNKRFKAFVAHSGVFNLESMYGATEELWFPNWEYGGPYWEEKNKLNYNINSPHRYAQNWDTPIFISTGGYDFRVPYTQSLEAFTVAQSKGIPSKLVFFPEQNHLVVSLQEAILWYNEYFGFLDTHCMNLK